MSSQPGLRNTSRPSGYAAKLNVGLFNNNKKIKMFLYIYINNCLCVLSNIRVKIFRNLIRIDFITISTFKSEYTLLIPCEKLTF